MGIFKPDIEKLKNKKNIKGLVKALNHDDSTVRIEAAVALGEIGDSQAVEQLIKALKDQESSVRREAAIALNRLKKKTEKEERKKFLKILDLLDTLEAYGPDMPDYTRAYKEILNIGSDAIEILSEVMNSSRKGHPIQAAICLGWIGDPNSVEPLISCALNKNKHDHVRQAAILSLGEIRDPRAVDPLIDILESRGPYDSGVCVPFLHIRDLRVEVAYALAKIGGAKAKKALRRALRNFKETEQIKYIEGALVNCEKANLT